MLPYVGYVVLIEWTVKLILELFSYLAYTIATSFI